LQTCLAFPPAGVVAVDAEPATPAGPGRSRCPRLTTVTVPA